MMTAFSTPVLISENHIRKLDVGRDLNRVADLIEACFPIYEDQDGQMYVRQMRKAAREMQFLRWASGLSDLSNHTAAGFVWEEDRHIVGNLSLIRFSEAGRQIHLIANVAVDPDYRQRGIGKALTVRAIEYLRQRGERHTWLQVRNDNSVAYHLYESLGFKPKFTRTTWRACPHELSKESAGESSSLFCHLRQRTDWHQQRSWLEKGYPYQMRWNLPVDFKRFEPDPFYWLANILEGAKYRHWSFKTAGELVGVISWQKTTTYANNLWIAFDESQEQALLRPAIQKILKKLQRRHPISIDYPEGRAVEVFSGLGFHLLRSLVWMCCDLH